MKRTEGLMLHHAMGDEEVALAVFHAVRRARSGGTPHLVHALWAFSSLSAPEIAAIVEADHAALAARLQALGRPKFLLIQGGRQ